MSTHAKKTGGTDLASLRARLEGKSGPAYWRSLEELAGTEEFRAFLGREFPEGAEHWSPGASRRTFLQLMGASLALAGLEGCTHQPGEKIVPYVRQPEQMVPGKPLYYATALSLGGYGVGVVAESHMGRPIMVEGNERHPASLGAMDPRIQAQLLTFYDPDRSQVVRQVVPASGDRRRERRVGTWDAFLATAIDALDAQRPGKGAGIRILTETVTSPTLARQLRAFLKEFPRAKWHQYEPINRDNARAGARLAFGDDVVPRLRFDRARVIACLEADPLGGGPGWLRNARQFAENREVLHGPDEMNRLYAVESTPSITGAMADHRLRVRSAEVAGIAWALAARLGVEGASARAKRAPVAAAHERWVEALARDLQRAKGLSLVVAGESQPPVVHALAHAMNHALGAVGQSVTYAEPAEAEPVAHVESLRALARDLEAGAVEVLFVLGGNPAYDAPADLGFGDKLGKARLKVRVGLYDDETSELCDWHVPEAHELESWGDVRAFDGTVTIRQPLIAPLYGARTADEMIAALLRHPSRSAYQIVRDTWRARHGGDDFEAFWQKSVHDGIVAGTQIAPKKVALRSGFLDEAGAAAGAAPAGGEPQGLEIVFRPDPSLWDGRLANNGWLQELPRPFTKITWDNAAILSPATARSLGVDTEDVVALSFRGVTAELPVWVQPGQSDGVVTVHLGYGRTRAGRVGTGVGVDTYALRPSDALWSGGGAEVRRTGRTYGLSSTIHHRLIESRGASREEEKRDLVREATLADFLKHPGLIHGGEAHGKPEDETPGEAETMYPGYEYNGHAWGMAVNLNTCIGCNACVLACQAENNIPIVGKDEVRKGREMHWIDLDRYYHGSLEDPSLVHQPRLCMHCENAPCELVCPVEATVHDHEGLNQMVYNRCVGTRYCGNNCPYKVRHFNFLQYADTETPSLKLLNNPDVTVRGRGVMEKCTYCVQRINAGRYRAESEGRPIRDGEVVTACQAACPTRAIVFGDINDHRSAVARLKADPRNYGMLTQLNTRPRTTYIAKLRNPNPELESEPSHGV